MNKTQVSTGDREARMSPEAQRIAIAERCGHFPVSYMESHGQWTPAEIASIPDYLSDLNAMHEAEQMLRRKYGHLSGNNLHRDYLMRLMQLLNPGVKLWDNGTFLGDWANVIVMAEATAAQRAEAFLRTLNLWKPYQSEKRDL